MVGTAPTDGEYSIARLVKRAPALAASSAHAVLEGRVTVLLRRHLVRLVLEHLQSPDHLRARVTRVDDVVNEAACSGHIRVGELLLVLLDELLAELVRVLRLGQLSAGGGVDGRCRGRETGLRARVGAVDDARGGGMPPLAGLPWDELSHVLLERSRDELVCKYAD